MKIVITGAGGGHFYPLIAVAERIRKEAFVQKIQQPEFFFFSDKPYDEEALFGIDCTFIQIPAGKLRLYPSFETIIDIFKMGYGCIVALIKLYSLYPDVVFVKGGYASFPTVFAARILSIPVVVHESDTIPGRTTQWAGKFASRVALSYPEAASFYPKETVALTGQPIRDAVLPPSSFKRIYTKKERPVLLVLGGSQGSQTINTLILQMLPTLLNSYDVVHQTGKENIEQVKADTHLILEGHQFRDRYFADGFIDLVLFYPKVDLVITRAGSSMFEMAVWELPMIVIPIPETVSRDQRSNAYAMASQGIATVLEENNIGVNVTLSIISRIFSSEEEYMSMLKNVSFFKNSSEAATVIAREIIRIGLSHS
jgi:UDP-N-acetylglucosamine--N-acetylmuramyl-(pentapeptide) pyrophosphoryl-undecaprenol N-acetylglucosamine transferase